MCSPKTIGTIAGIPLGLVGMTLGSKIGGAIGGGKKHNSSSMSEPDDFRQPSQPRRPMDERFPSGGY